MLSTGFRGRRLLYPSQGNCSLSVSAFSLRFVLKGVLSLRVPRFFPFSPRRSLRRPFLVFSTVFVVPSPFSAASLLKDPARVQTRVPLSFWSLWRAGVASCLRPLAAASLADLVWFFCLTCRPYAVRSRSCSRTCPASLNIVHDADFSFPLRVRRRFRVFAHVTAFLASPNDIESLLHRLSLFFDIPRKIF